MKLLHRHDEQLSKLEKLTKELETSPAFRKVREQAAAETLKEREAAASRIQELHSELEEAVVNPEIPKLEEMLAEIETQRKKLQNELQLKKQTISQAKFSLQARITKEKAFLGQSADPKIDEAIEFFKEKLDETRKKGIATNRIRAERNIANETKRVTLETNRKAVSDCLEYCQNALKILQNMKFDPIFDSARIDELKQMIPSTDFFQEIRGERKDRGGGNRVPIRRSIMQEMGLQ